MTGFNKTAYALGEADSTQDPPIEAPALPPGILYDPKLVRWERDWRDAGRRPGDTRKRGMIAFLRDNLFAPRP